MLPVLRLSKLSKLIWSVQRRLVDCIRVLGVQLDTLYCVQHFAGRIVKNGEKLQSKFWCLERHSKRGPPKYKTGQLDT